MRVEISARDRLFKIVNMYAAQVRRLAEEDGRSLREADLRFNIHSIIGGQMSADSAQRLFLIYPEGNWVEIGQILRIRSSATPVTASRSSSDR